MVENAKVDITKTSDMSFFCCGRPGSVRELRSTRQVEHKVLFFHLLAALLVLLESLGP